MDLDNPSILNYNIASCTTQIINIGKDAVFRCVMLDVFPLHTRFLFSIVILCKSNFLSIRR